MKIIFNLLITTFMAILLPFTILASGGNFKTKIQSENQQLDLIDDADDRGMYEWIHTHTHQWRIVNETDNPYLYNYSYGYWYSYDYSVKRECN